MKKNQKRGFTIVELVIVIAVIAILAAVLIPTFAGLIEKANTSVDMQIVNQMNTVLQADEVVAGKPATVVDAKEILAENDCDDFTPADTQNVFYWVGSENRVILWTKDEGEDVTTGKVTYPKNYAEQFSSITTPSNDWADLSGDYNVSVITPEEDETIGVALLNAIQESESGAILKLPENSEANIGMYAYYIQSYMTAAGGTGKTLTIDLNGGKLVSNTELVLNGTNYGYYGITVPKNGTLELVNGDVEITTENAAYSAISGKTGSHIVLRDVNLITNGAGIYPSGDASEVVVEGSTIKAGAYGIGTNRLESSNIRIAVSNTTVEATNTMLINTPSDVSVQGCTFTAEGWGIIVRAGHVVVSDSTIATTDGDVGTGSTYSCGYKDFSYTQSSSGAPYWGTSYQMPYSVITVGDYSDGDSYSGDADITMNNVKLVSANVDDVPDIVLAANLADKNVTVNYDAASTVGKIVVFGEEYNRDTVTHTFTHPGNITVNGVDKTLD